MRWAFNSAFNPLFFLLLHPFTILYLTHKPHKHARNARKHSKVHLHMRAIFRSNCSPKPNCRLTSDANYAQHNVITLTITTPHVFQKSSQQPTFPPSPQTPQLRTSPPTFSPQHHIHNHLSQSFHHKCHNASLTFLLLPQLPSTPRTFTAVSEDAKGKSIMRIRVFWRVAQSASVRWGSFEDVGIALGFPQITTLKWSPAHVRGRRALPKTHTPC